MVIPAERPPLTYIRFVKPWWHHDMSHHQGHAAAATMTHPISTTWLACSIVFATSTHHGSCYMCAGSQSKALTMRVPCMSARSRMTPQGSLSRLGSRAPEKSWGPASKVRAADKHKRLVLRIVHQRWAGQCSLYVQPVLYILIGEKKLLLELRLLTDQCSRWYEIFQFSC